MIEKVIKIQKLNEHKLSSIAADLAYWLSRTAEDRVSTVEYLRRQYHGSTTRLQRSARVIKRAQR